ncbi:DUF2977 domain-containing protein [Mammaliicoccus sciuri]|uniref:DUF2977 domain-containing protein n=1 Tax=Mammaliicoccus sciuri TaxID=1296 RepID=UPI002DB81C68|nr:DUF2977 domain-containing protein [Mammaliicoccus sciuri]MEB5568398.1 DUF2977 domain-containing protein [Mammaliicoccus sciuri]
MKILLNDVNEIIGYVTEGDLKGSIEVEIPEYLLEDFQPRKLVYVNGKVGVNNNYSEEAGTPVQPPVVNVPGSDEELRKMFASMQVQLVQANMMVMQLSQQNARLSQEMVVINQKLDGGSE